jgi:hypothetical protein
MRVYFSSTVKAKKSLEKNFQLIYKTIEDLGHRNVSDFLMKVEPEKFYARPSGIATAHYRQMLTKIKSADAVVFEVSVASLGIGYLVNLVLDMEKPVILLHTRETPPYLFHFIKNEKLQVHEYSQENIKQVLSSALDVAKESANVRFTFFVTPRILQFFDFVAKKKKLPRAVYLRRIIEEAMKKEHFKTKNPF